MVCYMYVVCMRYYISYLTLFFDNYIFNNIEKSHISGVLSTHFSDHQMIFTILKTNFRDSNNSKKYVEIKLTSEENLEKFKAEINERNIYGVLDKNIAYDPNINIEILTNAIIDAKNMHIPIKRRKFNKRKDKKEVWMTDQLLELVNRKNDLYIELKKTPKLSNCYNTKKVNFKTSEGIVNREIADAKTQHYARVFQSYKSNMKKTWQIMNDTLSRNKKDKSLPEYIIIDGEKITEHKEITNIFNKYFANIGTKLASSINCCDQTQTFKSYLKSPTEKTFSSSKVCEPKVQQIINQMKKKAK